MVLFSAGINKRGEKNNIEKQLNVNKTDLQICQALHCWRHPEYSLKIIDFVQNLVIMQIRHGSYANCVIMAQCIKILTKDINYIRKRTVFSCTQEFSIC